MTRRKRKQTYSYGPNLNTNEKRILRMLADGFTFEVISEHCGISHQTIKRLLKKGLQLAGRHDVAALPAMNRRVVFARAYERDLDSSAHAFYSYSFTDKSALANLHQIDFED